MPMGCFDESIIEMPILCESEEVNKFNMVPASEKMKGKYRTE